ncbi:LysR family transcriptional regulator [Sporosarcina sp. Te-1]|uniref:LysR family transcriptional regulator n=1 Tax=Sporosarcina sp. Te-1 TaxID=2818390 RepID=UPI001A9E09C6|nr:LysR family transcriptional regulator [Sporosarcina sp. Te-1]QTD42115.1 LysR family transcriptional regulator [Sporosarcina sp. Te-1]
MEIRHFQTFQIVVEEQNLIQAAMRLNYSQPTVTKHLQQLEEEIGLPLFEKVDNRRRLTKAGEFLYEHSKNILNELFILQMGMEDLKGEKQTIRVCGLDEYCDRFFLPYIRSFQKKNPNVLVDVQAINSSDDALKAVIVNEADFAIVSGRPLNADISHQIIDYDDLVLFASSKVAKDPSRTEEYLAKYPVLVDHNAPFIKFEILKKGTNFSNTIQCNSDEGIKNAVLHHEYLGIMGTGRIKEEIRSGAVTILETYAANNPVKLVVLTKKLGNPVFRDFFTTFGKTYSL